MPVEGSWFGATIGTVISPFRDIFFHHAMFCLNAGKYVRDHRRYTLTLMVRRDDVQSEIGTGIPNGLIATDGARSWLARADEAISEEQTNHRRYDNRCRIFACCSLNCRGNYKIGKKAHEARREVEACINTELLNVTIKRPPPSVKDIPIQSAQLPGQESSLLRARQYTEDDLTDMIGIWGPDEVGNTHLLKKLNNSFVRPDPPYFVIFVTASRGCSVKKVQAQIIERLETTKDDDVATQATNISRLLLTRSFLLLVDGLTEELDLVAVGIPHPLGIIDGQFKRKVVITSRSKTVCDQMFVDGYIEVPGLGETESRKLFAETIGQEDIDSDPDIRALAHDLIKELKGVPSDLIYFGKHMVGKNSNPRDWEDVIRSVRKSNLLKKDATLAGRTLRNLEDAHKNLLARSKDVRLRIGDAERKCMTATNEVKQWLEKADITSSDVQIILEGYKLKKDVTMDAIEMVSEVQECLKACPDNNNIALVSVPPAVQEIPGPSMSLSAKNRNLEEALKFMKDDLVWMIGIWGQGGVGKTYLLRSINKSIDAAGGMSFYVIFVTASRGCSVEKMQGDILGRLGIKPDGSVENQKQMILRFLKERSFLLLLDDLWEQIDLQAVGIPYPLGIGGKFKRKVVLTTRLKNVCSDMEVREDLHITCLQEDEAWQLFQEKVGQKTILSDLRIEPLAKELVKELKGLPLALQIIGRTMCGKYRPTQWESAIRHMKLSHREMVDFQSMKTIFENLKFSYDSLQNKTLRDCFLTCALWPEDWMISKVDLAQCWMGLGLVHQDDIESLYSTAYTLIDHLTDASLIESWGDWYGYVKVHDVIRDMALWISCGSSENNDKWFVRARVGKHEKLSIPWSKAEYIALMLNQMHKFPPSDFKPCMMHLKMLCLRSFSLAGIIDQTISDFTSVTYLDLSRNSLRNLPDEMFSLVNLEHLDLSHNRLKEETFHRFRNLIKLKFLYLLQSGIETIPEGVLLYLKALEVVEIRNCRIFGRGGPANCDPKVCEELGILPKLKAASIGVEDFDEYKMLSLANKLPIRTLSLVRLKSEQEFLLSDISSLDFVQRALFELDISLCDMEIMMIGELVGQPCFPTLNKIRLFMLGQLKEIHWIGMSPKHVFPRLTCLDVHGCVKLEHLSWLIDLPCLEQLQIEMCISMKQAFLRPGNFSFLKYLRLSNNFELVAFGHPGVTFTSLERLVVDACPKLKRLPSLPLSLQELQFDKVEQWEELELELEVNVKAALQRILKLGISEDVRIGVYGDWCVTEVI